MKEEDVKIGMKVKIVSNPPQGYYGHGQVGDVLTITTLPSHIAYCGATGFIGEGGACGHIHHKHIEPVVESFTKSDLKTGMRVVYRDGNKRVIVQKVTFAAPSMHGSPLYHFRDDMLYGGNISIHPLDIMEVYAAPEKCEDFFNLDVRGELLFKREEKTEKQIQAEKLMEQADKLKAQFEALVKQATDLAGE